MKIGIITFWQSDDNYGQVLQCYALQKYLESLGHEPFLIKFSPRTVLNISYKKRLLKILKIYPLFQYFIEKIKKKKDLQYQKQLDIKNKRRNFNQFRTENIRSTEKIYNSLEELRNDPPPADFYITGSDQVWVMLLDQEDNKGYFLDFGSDKTKRISYAASFSREFYPVEFLPQLKHQLSKFDAISVREDVGVKICEGAGFKAIKTLDPTLLLPKSGYFDDKTIDKIDEKFFYVYSINIRDPKDVCWEEVCKYGGEKDLKAIVTTSSGHFAGREIFGNVEYSYATIHQWLNNINCAEFVVTTSFHGVVFCLIMNKNFIYFPLKGHYARGNNRVVSLLNSVGLSDKICWDKDNLRSCIEHTVEWESVNEKIEDMRLQSIQFLEDSLK